LPVFVLVWYANPVPQESCGSALRGPKNWWLYRLKVRAYGITSCALPLFPGVAIPLAHWFLMDSHWLIYKLVFKKLCPLLTRMNWVLFTQHWEQNISEKESGTCLTYITAAPNQTLTAVFIHSYRGQDHIMHIFLYLILITNCHTSCTHV